MKIKAPIIIAIPKTKRVRGAEPPLGLNSFRINETISTPNNSAGISGRIYCPFAKL
ncbi:MAG: hypothetical protein FWE44_07875 [Defluviitaleaceae bacterium]|nr:hypothetical protein [Defluviitaleaceae bacterium]